MKCLITGSAGFIGSNLVKKLKELKYEVVGIDNYSTGTIKDKDIEPTTWNDLSDVECIFHLGMPSSSPLLQKQTQLRCVKIC